MMTRRLSSSGGATSASGVERARARRRSQRRADPAERRDRQHRQRHRDEKHPAVRAGDDSAGDSRGDHHEGEFAARPEQQRDFGGDAVRRAEKPRQDEQRERLDDDEGRRQLENAGRARRKDREIELGADGDEEQAEQQALEGLDRHLDLAPIFGFGEQQAGDEGAQRHRQAAGGGGQMPRREPPADRPP